MDGRDICTVSGLHFGNAPLKIVRAQKQYMTDNMGVQYLDCVSSIAHVGHCHPQVVTAGKNQMGTLVTAQGFINDLLTKYVKQLVNNLPDILSVCYLVNSGSEANDLALRLARSYTNRMDVVVFDEAYHGNLGNLIDISPKMFKRMAQGKKEFVHVIPYPDIYRGPYREDDLRAAEKYVMEAKRIITHGTRNNRKVGCFISEPIVVNCGVIVPPRNYYRLLYNLIHEAGGVCIADEVQTGLGRTGEYFWAFEHYGVTPDIVTIGKPLGNGHPMAAVITTREIADALGEYYSTFGGNPVACAIGMAVLDVIGNEKLVQSAKAVGKSLLENLQVLKTKHSCVGDVRGMGLCLGIEIVEDRCSRKPATELTQAIVYRLKEDHHVLVQSQGPSRNVITVTPPMCFTQLNARSLFNALDAVLTTCAQEGIINMNIPGTVGIGQPRSVLSMEDLDNLEDDDVEGPEAKRPRTSYDDID
ncbi:ethanolamine-phosphate phospho-lyase-like [Panulirus ornatus]|uniref:ethanolamine-phosphate phospho-lyase-like n=1 Tax=Panulirus ornatus TaxID=150431 RepID=UPI003A88EB79